MASALEWSRQRLQAGLRQLGKQRHPWRQLNQARRLQLRHRLYANLLMLTLLQLAALAMPWHLRRLGSGIGSLLLHLLLIVGLGGDLRPGPRRGRSDWVFRLLGALTMATLSLWFCTNLWQRQLGLPLLGLLMVFSAWSLKRLVGDLAVERQVTSQVLMGAVAGYLFLGLSGGLMVSAMQTMAPDSFQASNHMALPPLPEDPQNLAERLRWDALFVRMVYYAFVCLSTLGFGDILPQSRAAMMLSVGFTVVGPVYMAVVMGVLISRFTLQTSRAEAQRERERRRVQRRLLPGDAGRLKPGAIASRSRKPALGTSEADGPSQGESPLIEPR